MSGVDGPVIETKEQLFIGSSQGGALEASIRISTGASSIAGAVYIP